MFVICPEVAVKRGHKTKPIHTRICSDSDGGIGKCKWHSLGQVLPVEPPKERVDQIFADKDPMMQPVGCVGPMLLQVPLDGMHVEVSVFH